MNNINSVKRILRAHGMREAYTGSGVNILYCGVTAFRIVNDYVMEVWNHRESSSGSIVYYNSPEEMCTALLDLGLESLGEI